MGQQQSKGELLYQQVSYGNTEGIKALHREGAPLEWVDREGKTPLIVACLNPELYNVAKTLIQLGANVNAYRPGRNGGTPLHHAAKRGLVNTVKLLLSHGANALVMNDDCQTALEVARAKGYNNVVHTIEGHVCLFSGWMREFYGPGFLEVLAPQFLSRKVWVVILPTGSRNPTKPFKLELAVYSSVQDARPRTVIALWRANLEEPKFHNSDPSVTIDDNSTKTRIKLASGNEGDRQQLQWFCDACKGIPQATHPPVFLHNSESSTSQATAPQSAEDLELAMAINASIQSAITEAPVSDTHFSEASASASSSSQSNMSAPMAPPSQKTVSNPSEAEDGGPSGNVTPQYQIQNNVSTDQTTSQVPDLLPSAPPIVDEVVEDGPIHYPSIDSTPVDLTSPSEENIPAKTGKKKENGESSSCIICLDAPVEGACIPCGHMVGCMSCLNEIKAKKWGCPVCRAKIEQVVKLYAV
ncbi:putative E3 ubiquitin-protein ligase XBAT35 isoform X2 [Mercurialis annua]|uniref:putative E3 ubiquitin-protein ligase XBAT35 isoform X2 n=1 Tax=Mercurialis annua TaxID=3986 RepID=UPI00215DFE9C|nr:putative E3 ubiquitin-protein ligase XBAT35 isoform X2 [Mercurialis annua]